MYSLLKMLLAEAIVAARDFAVLQAALLFSAITISHAQIQTINEYTVPSGQFSQPVRIIVGPDGALWFTDNINARIGRITTAGTITSFAVPATILWMGHHRRAGRRFLVYGKGQDWPNDDRWNCHYVPGQPNVIHLRHHDRTTWRLMVH
jgi:hypothetical protein